MPRALIIAVRFHDGRFHGRPEWPPSPARLFQALVAAAATGAHIEDRDQQALAWLECLDSPLIVAPPARKGQPFANFVPNNDLDAKDGDPARVAEIRAPKWIRPHLFELDAQLLYQWHFVGEEMHAQAIAGLANRLYQLGRGIDMAWASAEILDLDNALAKIDSGTSRVYRPCKSGAGPALPCPQPGSLQSLIDRYKATGERFAVMTEPAPTRTDPDHIKVVGQTFSQPPKPRFRQVAYDSPPVRLLFELRARTGTADFFPWPLTEIVRLVESVRDGAAKALGDVLPDQRACIERVFIGRGATEADKASRLRIIPLPSIGHVHAERSIRRLLVEVPPDCPLDPRDIAWAFTAWVPHDRETGELSGWQFVQIDEHTGERYAKMPGHYGIGERVGHRRWRTITPAALPENASRRRIDPIRRREEAKKGSERAHEEASAATAVCQALRHAGIATPAQTIRVQREPFEAKGARAETFAPGTRFSRHALWHVEIAFAAPVSGPLVIGDGRYLGLGLMAPAQAAPAIHTFASDTAVGTDAAPQLARALRRAVMARVRGALGKGPDDGLPLFFSGHEQDGSPANHEHHAHLFFAVEPGPSPRLLILAPHIVLRRSLDGKEAAQLRTLDMALAGFTRLKAGSAGVLELAPLSELQPGHPLLGPARTWESRTPYCPTRHARRGKDAAAALISDAITECSRRGLPQPTVEIVGCASGPRGGHVSAYLRLDFAVAVEGPVLLGRDSHMGGGLFVAVR